MTNYQLSEKVDVVLRESLPRLVSLAKRGLPCEKLAESIREEAGNIIMGEPKSYTWQDVRDAACKVMGIEVVQFESKSRRDRCKTARQLFYLICFERKLLSLSEMGEITSRDHTTAISGRNRLANLLYIEDPIAVELYAKVMDILQADK